MSSTVDVERLERVIESVGGILERLSALEKVVSSISEKKIRMSEREENIASFKVVISKLKGLRKQFAQISSDLSRCADETQILVGVENFQASVAKTNFGKLVVKMDDMLDEMIEDNTRRLNHLLLTHELR